MRELSPTEYATLDSCLSECGWKRNGASVYWDKDCAFGAYDAIRDRIRLMDMPNMIRELTPCVVHELTHRQQYRKMGWLWYSLYNLTRTRLEPDAIVNERKAEQILKV